jgi:putative (di)nucleoside polyphosphate hydrolase
MTILPTAPGLSDGELPYRVCVGIMLINSEGLVWVGRRRPKWAGEQSAPIWQMPQGGIEKYEPPRIAALRELREETGITSVEIVAEHPDWLAYELPDRLMGVALKGRYRGQRQKWFAMRFLGSDDEIDISSKFDIKAEFDAWRWTSLASIPTLAVPFKRGIYDRITHEFAHLAAQQA